MAGGQNESCEVLQSFMGSVTRQMKRTFIYDLVQSGRQAWYPGTMENAIRFVVAAQLALVTLGAFGLVALVLVEAVALARGKEA
jgi:hypothetical protein